MGFNKLDNDLGEFGAIHSQELAFNLRKNFEILFGTLQIGEIVPIMTNIPGVPTPDANIWQLCDGSEITNLASPLRSLPSDPRFTPDLSDNRYPRMKTTALGTIGNSGGTNQSPDLTHTHNIVEHEYTDKTIDGDKDGVPDVSEKHTHTVPPEPLGIFDMEPSFSSVNYFMRIS